MALIVLIILTFLLVVNASLVANYPVNAQLPPVARVSKPFNFTFSQGTFGGTDSETQFSLANAPSWLKLDSNSRTLSGTPQAQDARSVEFDLIASNESGSLGMPVTLIVTTGDGPQPGKPLLPQLEAIGATSAPSTILVHSGDSFLISFDPATFTNTNSSTLYYGTSLDNAPLPSWVTFEQSALRFSGTAPNTGIQSFTFNLVASDVPGFSGTSMSFVMTVSPHILSFNQSAQTFFIGGGKQFTSPQFLDILTLDGREPASSDLTTIEADAPSWLTFNNDTISLSGTPPADTVNENITISVTDTYQDVARLIVTLQYSQFFNKDVKGCEAVIGDDFMFVFNSSILSNDSLHLDVDLGQQLPWLQYNPVNKTLYGHVPSDLQPQQFEITLTASEGTAEDSERFTINAVQESQQDRGTLNSTGDNGHNIGIHGKKAGIIALSIVIPFFFISSLLLGFCCWRHKRRAEEHTEGQLPNEKGHPPQPGGSDLSHCQPFEETIQGEIPLMLERPSKAPKLELAPLWSQDSADEDRQNHPTTHKGKSNSYSTIDWDFAPLRDPEPEQENQAEDVSVQSKRLSYRGSPKMRSLTNTNSIRREPLKSIQPRRSMKRNSAMSSKSKRLSKRSSGISVASGLPARLSGAGHGAGGWGPPGHGVVRTSWQNTQISLQSDETSLVNLAPLFPRPPPRRRNSIGYGVSDYPKKSMRAVEPSSPTTSEPDWLEAFVHSRAKSRNSSNTMFAGQSTRRRSSGLRALERARSTASRADTMASSVYNEERRSLTSGYTDQNRSSSFLQSLPEASSSALRLGRLANRSSQLYPVQHYSKIISPLPRFFSEISLSSARRDMTTGSENSSNLNRDNGGSQYQWAKGNPYLQEYDGSRRYLHRKSPSTSSVPFDSNNKVRRVSLMRYAGKENDLDLVSESGDIAFV